MTNIIPLSCADESMFANSGHAVDIGHAHVEQHAARLQPRRFLQKFMAALEQADGVAAGSQHEGQRPAGRIVIVDHMEGLGLLMRIFGSVFGENVGEAVLLVQNEKRAGPYRDTIAAGRLPATRGRTDHRRHCSRAALMLTSPPGRIIILESLSMMERCMTNPAHVMVLGLLASGCVTDTPADASPSPTETRRLPGTGGIMAPPSDPEAAIRSEFAAIERKGTAQAYALFARRHPGHALAEEARRRAAALDGQAPRHGDPAPCPGGDPRNCQTSS